MTRSLSFKDKKLPAAEDTLYYSAAGDILVSGDIQSETYYQGDKGDEVADYSLNFKLGDTTNKRVPRSSPTAPGIRAPSQPPRPTR